MEMPQKPLSRNFCFILGNPLKLEKGDGFLNIFESFPNIYSWGVSSFFLYISALTFKAFPFNKKTF